MARPTDYTSELVERARDYIKEVQSQLTDVEAEYKICPTIAGLALELGVSRETVYAWAKDEDKREFSDIVERVQTLQEHFLTKYGLWGTYNSTITKLMLSKHGYREGHDVTSNGKALVVAFDPSFKQ